jgi:transposase
MALAKKAVLPRKALALEGPRGMRERTSGRREHRYGRHSWAFVQLRAFLTCAAAWGRNLVFLVDPRSASRTCSRCGHCDKANRKSQAEFFCQRCGAQMRPDYNAMCIIVQSGERAKVNRPILSPWEG